MQYDVLAMRFPDSPEDSHQPETPVSPNLNGPPKKPTKRTNQKGCPAVSVGDRFVVLPDENRPKLYRVAHKGSEFTVSHKSQLQHGLTRKKAQQVLQMLEKRKLDAIDRLAAALTEYNDLTPDEKLSEQVKQSLSHKYLIGRKTLHTAILMMAGGINAEIKS
jgi:hypothetical protein